MDHALSPYFIIAAVWNGMEHRECIGGGEKTTKTTKSLLAKKKFIFEDTGF